MPLANWDTYISIFHTRNANTRAHIVSFLTGWINEYPTKYQTDPCKVGPYRTLSYPPLSDPPVNRRMYIARISVLRQVTVELMAVVNDTTCLANFMLKWGTFRKICLNSTVSYLILTKFLPKCTILGHFCVNRGYSRVKSSWPVSDPAISGRIKPLSVSAQFLFKSGWDITVSVQNYPTRG